MRTVVRQFPSGWIVTVRGADSVSVMVEVPMLALGSSSWPLNDGHLPRDTRSSVCPAAMLVQRDTSMERNVVTTTGTAWNPNTTEPFVGSTHPAPASTVPSTVASDTGTVIDHFPSVSVDAS